jgi:hypothetical protein
MFTLTEEQQRNAVLAQQIHQDARTNPRSPYVGKWVALLHGQIAATADTMEEAIAQLEAQYPGQRAFLVDTDADPEIADEIWRLIEWRE